LDVLVERWRGVCQEVGEYIRAKIDPVTFATAQTWRSGWQEQETMPRTSSAENVTPQTVTLRAVFRMLGVEDLTLLRYSSEEDAFIMS